MRASITGICRIYGLTRQAFYKAQRSRAQQLIYEDRILQHASRIRRAQPRVGGRKLYKMLIQIGVQIGRDHLFRILRNNKLLIRPVKNFKRTTNSYHRFRKHRNLIKDMTITRPNQVFVCDITYLDTMEGFCYLALITDLYSRKIVGWNVGRTLNVEGCQKALKIALNAVRDPELLIHHSDRGYQYCSPRYTAMLEKRNIRISMTEENHVYENAVAERVNGILKTEFLLGERLRSFNEAKRLATQSIKTYNEARLHSSLDYQTPAQRHAA